eukprot:CAMPEP_0181307408 /NCGR_PEP_ID=MMETSP1101-20121128/10863_1 /TAXON_ID=46948 /ORGANISM="Rhodomonas abbreviata, Strain Caron Lab Isolate" /LENGTH=140 /DNA_ID=CAMNT_0023413621 /DNA_START=26 /DNA_END=449 /DNA_ORIENTATION=-
MSSSSLLAMIMALCAVSFAAAQWERPPMHEFQALEVVPVPMKFRPVRGQILCENGMSEECQKILDGREFQPDPLDEEWAFGEGFYKDYEDLDPDADVGIIEMPYQFDADLLQSHKISISGVERAVDAPTTSEQEQEQEQE